MRALALVLLFVNACGALRASLRSPLVFVVTALQGAHPRGTSLRTDQVWIAGRVPDDVATKLLALYPAATVETVHTDDEARMHDRIQAWMDRQCAVVHNRARSDCWVVSANEKYTLKTVADVYDFRRSESTARIALKHALVAYEPLRTSSPTFRVTPKPTLSKTCEGRDAAHCGPPQCDYVGWTHGCRPVGWCGFSTKLACEAKPKCEFRRGYCRPKLTR
jgi:hypothetical protein